jgi:hypothetical protein
MIKIRKIKMKPIALMGAGPVTIGNGKRSVFFFLFFNLSFHHHHAFMAFQFDIGDISVSFLDLFFGQMGGAAAPALGAGRSDSVFLFLGHDILLFRIHDLRPQARCRIPLRIIASDSRIVGFAGTVRRIAGIIHKRTVFLTGRAFLGRGVGFQIISAIVANPACHGHSPYVVGGIPGL